MIDTQLKSPIFQSIGRHGFQDINKTKGQRSTNNNNNKAESSIKRWSMKRRRRKEQVSKQYTRDNAAQADLRTTPTESPPYTFPAPDSHLVFQHRERGLCKSRRKILHQETLAGPHVGGLGKDDDGKMVPPRARY